MATPDHMVAPDVWVEQSVPHTALLPHVDVAIHHGGAGTTHAMIRAGVPSLIMPFLADQPWWANRLHREGLGPPALSRTTTNPETIAQAITAALGCSDRLQSAALQMSHDDGLQEALRILEDAEAGMHSLRPA